MRSTQEVLDHHLGAFNQGLDSILSDYNDDSCVISQQGSFHGLSDIRDFFTAYIKGMPEGMMDAFNVTESIVDEEIAYITWEALPWFPLGTDTFVIREGRIRYQTFAVHAAG